MKRLLFASGVAWATAAVLIAQPATPFKVGSFERQGRKFVGVVLREALVIDLAAAAAALKVSKTTPPTDMKDLIARYDSGVRDLIVEIITAVGSNRPDYVHDVKTIKKNMKGRNSGISIKTWESEFVNAAGAPAQLTDPTKPAEAQGLRRNPNMPLVWSSPPKLYRDKP